MHWLVYLVLAVVAWFAFSWGYSFFAFLVFIALIILVVTQTSGVEAPAPLAGTKSKTPIIIDTPPQNPDSGPGRFGRMNFVMVSHKQNIEYQDYHNANFGLTLNNIGRGIADLLTPRPKKKVIKGAPRITTGQKVGHPVFPAE